MKIKDISQVKEWRGVCVLVRVDFNVPLLKNKVKDDFKIKACLPLLMKLVKAGARVVVISHLADPKLTKSGRVTTLDQKRCSLAPVASRLKQISKLKVRFSKQAFGTVLLEAMASGLPVIASDLPGVRSVVDKKSNGFLVKPRDISSLAKYLDLLLKNPQMAGQFGQAGRAKVLAKYDWSHIGRSVEKIFEDILS